MQPPFALCMDNHMPILVFNMNEPGAIKKAVSGEQIGTLVQLTPRHGNPAQEAASSQTSSTYLLRPEVNQLWVSNFSPAGLMRKTFVYQ